MSLSFKELTNVLWWMWMLRVRTFLPTSEHRASNTALIIPGTVSATVILVG